jgi:hypothetical protein
MSNWTDQKDLLDVATRAIGLSLGLLYVIGLLITNVYFARFGISDFSMLRVRYLTTGFAFLGFSLLPLIVLLVPILAFYYLRGQSRNWKISVPASLLAFLVVSFTGYLVFAFVVRERTPTAPFFLYAVPAQTLEYEEWLKCLITWFTPVLLVLFLYAPLCAMFITWRIGKLKKAALVVCIPLVLFGIGSILTRFAGGHYQQLRPVFGGPITTLSDVLVASPACHYLGLELESDSDVCVLRGIILLHETSERIYVRQPGRDGRVLQIPITQVRLIADVR